MSQMMSNTGGLAMAESKMGLSTYPAINLHKQPIVICFTENQSKNDI